MIPHRSRVLLAVALTTIVGVSLLRAQTPPTETLTFAPVADTWVDKDAPTTNLNSDVRLRMDAAPDRVAYLRFTVAGVRGRSIQRARLRLGATGATVHGGTIHRISNDTWNEATITYNVRPAVDGPALASLGAVAIGQTVEFPLDGVVTADGTYSFAIDSPNGDGASYNSAAATSGLKPALVLTVASGPEPTVTIVQPQTGASFFAGDTVTLQATASDAVDGNLSSAVAWSSNVQGPLGTGATLSTALALGTHTVTARVTDHDNFSASAQVTVTVTPPPPANTEPLVTITAPTPGPGITAGTPVTFIGTATDLEDGVLTARLAWTSDRDGALGTGGTVTKPLTAGMHRITARVTDSKGVAGTASLALTVVAPPIVEFTPVADTYVDSATPTKNFATQPVLRAAATTRTGYLRFTVAGLGGNAIARAVLRLQVDSGTSAGSDGGGTLRRISNVTWPETITFNTRPAVDGVALGTLGAVALGQTVEFDVTAAVQAEGAVAFALVGSSTNTVDYRTRESATPPRLIVTIADNAPHVAITSPANQAIVTAGTPVVFTGSADDREDGDVSETIRWTSSRDGFLGTGASLSSTALHAGTHTITAEATDSDSHVGHAELSLRVRDPNTPPQIAITAPTVGTSVSAGTPLGLAATVSDDFDAPAALTVTWASSLSGPLGTGGALTIALAEGSHILTATATDGDGASSSASVGVTVTPVPPTVAITAPAAGTTVFSGNPLTFTGTARAGAGADLSAGLVWTSDRDGALGTGASITASALSVGTHVVTAAATASGLTGQAQRSIVVLPPNALPVLAIQAPTDGALLLTGRAVLLAATATDAEDGNLAAAIRWTSSRDGALGTGGVRTVANLTVGTHVLTASVTDRHGGTASASVTVSVSTASLLFTAVADTWVDSGAPTKNFGTDTGLTVGAKPVQQAFLRFVVAGTGGFAVDKAILRLTVGTKSADASKAGGTVATVSSPDWSEATTTYANRPAIDGPPLQTKGAVKTKALVEFDVTAALRGDGTYGFGLTTTNTDWVRYQSRESASAKPQLVVTLKLNTAPVVAITAPAPGTKVGVGVPVTLAATATDAESGNLGSQIAWTSSRDGALGRGATLTLSTLSPGAHTITARVSDPGGASAEATTTLVVNHPPVIAITAPADGLVMFAADLPLLLAATASDVEDGDLGARVRWSSSLDGALGTGASLSAGALRVGIHTLTASVADDAGATADATVRVRVRAANTPPVITITRTPVTGTTPAGTEARFAGAVSDDFDTTLAASLRWTSSRDGALGTGAAVARVLTEGAHTIIAEVTDSDGATGLAQAPFTVSPTPPVVAITAPTTGAILFAERPLTLTGTASDATDGNIASNLIWSSDRNGLLGAGASVTTSVLVPGTHVITAAVTDAGGLRTQAQTTLVIRPRNTPPVVAITAPADGVTLLSARRLRFTATASDTESGNLDAVIDWRSSRDGLLGRGPLLVTSALSVGTHVLSASVIDQAGETTAASITVTIIGSTVSVPAIADTTLDAGAPGTVFGTATTLTADASPIKQMLLRFRVAGIAPFAVGRARLRLTTIAATAGSSDRGGELHTITDSTWSELSTSYANRPAIDGPTVATVDSVGRNDVVDFDLTGVVQGDGTYDFALVTPSTNDVVYQSREAASGTPQLILELRRPTDSQVTITAPLSGSSIGFELAATFLGSATDLEDGNLDSSLAWSSNIDGVLGAGPLVTRWLSPGSHTITASVIDADGNPGSAAVRLEVLRHDVGFYDFAFPGDIEDGQSNEATAQKPESKLWYVDGIWWATLYRESANAHRIHRLDPVTQAWIDTGVLVDERGISRQDVLWDGSKLYMVSRAAGDVPENRLLRYTYIPGAKTWVRDAGYPVELPGGGTESLTIAKDSTGRFWVAFTFATRVYVAHSLGSDREWSPAIELPVGTGEETLLDPDDIATVIALPGKIGVFWSNQLTRDFYFAVHTDGHVVDSPSGWRLETIEGPGKFADDHFNLKVSANGTLYAMVKTNYGAPGEILDGLLVRQPNGTWSPLIAIALVDENPTRELLMLDEIRRKIYVFYSLDHQSLYYKVSDMDQIAFPEGAGIPAIVSAAVTDISNPTSTKQNITPAMGLVVLASSRADSSYWHNVIVPPTP